MKEKTYYIHGMHCASCEILLEKGILEYPGVESVDASVGGGTVHIVYDGTAPKIQKLNTKFKKDGYTFSEEKLEDTKAPLFYFVQGKGLQVDKALMKQKLKKSAKILLALWLLYKLEKTGIARYVTVQDSSSLGLFFLFGIVAGLSSCAALVGGILLSLAKGWNEKLGYDASFHQKVVPHIRFHVGRVIGYGAFGLILGGVGQVIAIHNVTFIALMTIFVSLIMGVVGLQMMGVRWAEKLQIRLPKSISRKVAGAEGESARLPFFIGAGTILLPCGFTLIVQGLALTTGSAIRGSLMLVAFTLGTMIPLSIIGLISVRGSMNPARSRALSYYVGIVILLFALYNVNGQLNVLGLPSVNDIRVPTAPHDEEPAVRAPKNGEQIVKIAAQGFEYSFMSESIIHAGIPTKLIVDNRGVVGCGAFLAARGLIRGFVSLKPGENVIDLGSPKKGTYKITCSMGMVPPITLTVK